MYAFSVLLSVYKNEIPGHFESALNSVIKQTVVPNEIVLIRDGPVSAQLQASINNFLTNSVIPVKYIPLDTNGGLGNALRIGIEACSNPLIARMDTDDISVPNRFEQQLKAFAKYPDIDVVGGQIAEFENEPSVLTGSRVVPYTHSQIVQYSKSRNPFNHPTVMYRKDAVLAAGNYVELKFLEDYFLWCRMILNHCHFMNLSEILVYMRVNSNTYKRRGGYRYFKALKKLEQYKRKHGLINMKDYVFNIVVRFSQSVLLPPQLRGFVYKRILRWNCATRNT